MDIRQLRHFLAVAETLHFGKAAEQLCMTQPPLSQSIMALERELGASLFTRSKRSVVLTPFGEQWRKSVQVALDGVDKLGAIAQALLTGEAGTLELSFVSTADYSVLPALVQGFRELYPRVELALSEATSDVQITRLLEGKGNAGLIIADHESPLPSSLAYLGLVKEPLLAAVPQQWLENGRLLVDGQRLTPSELVKSPLIVFPRYAAPSFYDIVTGYYVSCGGQLNIAQHAIQMQTIISLVSAGMGIALVPASLRNLARVGVSYVELAVDAPHLETGVVFRRDDSSPALANLLQMIRSSM